MLDCRALRTRQDDPDGPAKSMLAGISTPVNQKEWLKSILLNSTAVWKFITCGVIMNPTVARGGTWYDYPDERNEILNYIADNNIKNVVFFSGDYHTGGAIDDGTYSGIPEVLVPNTNLNNGPGPGVHGDWSVGIRGEGPVEPYGNGFSLVTIDTNPDTVTLETRGVENEVRLQLVLHAQ
jgi:alkaline phosphatase D